MAQKNGRSSKNDAEEEGPSVDWRNRLRRQRMWSAFKLLLFVAILGALVGLGIVYKAQILKLLSPAQVAQPTPPPKVIEQPRVEPAKPPEKIVEPPKEVKPPEKIVEQPRATQPDLTVVDAEEKRARELLAETRKLFEKFDFLEGKKRCDQAAALKATRAVHEQAVQWGRKAGEFDLGTRHIEVSDYASAETTYRITALYNGNQIEMQGLIYRETKDVCEFQRIPDENPATLGKMKIPIPPSDILKKTAVTLTERQAEFGQLLSRLESGLEMGPSSKAGDFYDLVFLSKRLGMGKECLEYLERAYAKAPEGQLGNLFRKLVVDRAIGKAALQAAAGRKFYAESELGRLLKTLPSYQVAQDEVEAFRATRLNQIKEDFKSTLVMQAKPAAAPAQPGKKPETSARDLAAAASDSGAGANEEIGKVDSSGVVGTGAAASLVDKANSAYEIGMATYRKYQQGTKGNNNQILQEAAKYLDQAVDLYGKALDKDPKNKSVENRQVEANMILYACRKYLTM